jgi:guanylate kinase
VIVISAPSGAGKTTFIRRLLRSLPGLRFSVSHTTRLPRPGEKDGREYFFVSQPVFERMVASGGFVEWAEVHGKLYGTSWKSLRQAQQAGEDVLLDIDVQGHRQVRRQLPEAVSIFLLPPCFAELGRRLRRRQSGTAAPEGETERRLANARREIRHWREYDFLIVNDKIAAADRALRAVVTAARSRRLIQQDRARAIVKTFGGKPKNGFVSSH